MAEKQDQEGPAQSESFGLIDARNDLIERVHESDESPSDAESAENEENTEDAPEEEQQPEEAEKEPDEQPPVDPEYEKLKNNYENTKGALTEARAKRDAAREENARLQAQLQEVLNDYKDLTKKLETPAEPNEDEYTDPTVRDLKTEIANLKNEISQLTQDRNKEKETNAQELYYENLTTTDKELEEQGYPGFYFGRAAVQDELFKLVKEDRDNVKLDTPEGWKQVYIEKVWPKISHNFVEFKKKKDLEEKTEQKKRANLVVHPGSGKQPEVQEDEQWSYKDYLKERRKVQIS